MQAQWSNSGDISRTHSLTQEILQTSSIRKRNGEDVMKSKGRRREGSPLTSSKKSAHRRAFLISSALQVAAAPDEVRPPARTRTSTKPRTRRRTSSMATTAHRRVCPPHFPSPLLTILTSAGTTRKTILHLSLCTQNPIFMHFLFYHSFVWFAPRTDARKPEVLK